METHEFTIDDLTTILRECAGEDEGVDLAGDIGSTEFEELGYESLALLEAAGRIERDYGIELGDDALNDAKTPSALLAIINERLLNAEVA